MITCIIYMAIAVYFWIAGILFASYAVGARVGAVKSTLFSLFWPIKLFIFFS